MKTPAPKPNNGPAVAAALLIFAVFWVFAAVLLGMKLWQDVPATFDDDANTLAVNTGAVTVVVLCALGACLCGVGAGIVDQLAKRQTVAVEND